MEKKDAVEKLIGKETLELLLKEIKDGLLSKIEVKKIALEMKGGVHGKYKDLLTQLNGNEIALADVMGYMLDVWVEVPNAGRDQLINILTKQNLNVLVEKMESNKQTTTTRQPVCENTKKSPEKKWTAVNDHSYLDVPGVEATVDDQGNTNLCTSYAVAKAVLDGMDRGKWTNGEEYDVIENTTALVEEKMDHINKGGAVWPEKFRDQTIKINVQKKGEENTIKARVTFHTQTIRPSGERYPQGNDTVPELVDLDRYMSGDNTIPQLAVLVVDKKIITAKKEAGRHTVYAKSYDPNTGKFHCLNSWGDKQFPKPEIDCADVLLLELISATVEIIN